MDYLTLRKRTTYLRGETDYSVANNLVICDHINNEIKEICNQFPFSWNLTSATLALSAGTADLPTNYNPKFRIYDARIVGANTADDVRFSEIPIEDRDNFQNTSVYWITYNTTTSKYVFNTPTQTGSIVIFYYFIPTDLSADGDVCIVPDGEAVAYGASSKMYIGDERNVPLKQDYEQESQKRIQSLWNADNMFGPVYAERSIAGDNLGQND